jgi:hypothetical protein
VPSLLTCSGVFPNAKRFGLRKDVRDQHVVVPAQIVQALRERDKVTRDQVSTLMDQLVERVLTIGPRLPPIDRTGRIADLHAFEGHVLAIALHGQLLQVRGKAFEILFVGQYGDRLSPEKVGIPDAQQPQEHWQIAFEGCGAEVLVHLVKPLNIAWKFSGPMASMVERPIAESIE